MTSIVSKHDGFEFFQDAEPSSNEHYNEDEVYEGVVQHACHVAMVEMTEIGQIRELLKMIAEIVSSSLAQENKGQ